MKKIYCQPEIDIFDADIPTIMDLAVSNKGSNNGESNPAAESKNGNTFNFVGSFSDDDK